MSTDMTGWIFLLMGVFLIVVGIVIWAGKKIDLVHGDEAYKVESSDVKPYAKILGIGVILMGVGVSLYGGLALIPQMPPFVKYIALALFCGVGLLIVYLGHKKYFKGEI